MSYNSMFTDGINFNLNKVHCLDNKDIGYCFVCYKHSYDEISLHIVNIKSKVIIHTISFSKQDKDYPSLNVCDISNDNKYVLLGTTNSSKIQLWNLESGKLIRETNVIGVLHKIQFSPDNKSFASIHSHETINIWNFETFVLLHTFNCKMTGSVFGIKYHQNGKYLLSTISTTFSTKIIVWNIETYTVHCEIGTIYYGIFGIFGKCAHCRNDFDKYGNVVGNKFVACKMSDDSVAIWNIETGCTVVTNHKFKQKYFFNFSMRFTDDESSLICGDELLKICSTTDTTDTTNTTDIDIEHTAGLVPNIKDEQEQSIVDKFVKSINFILCVHLF